MKNKKLFAILTLVCFMFTLMPMAAFAAVTGDVTVSTADTVAADSIKVDAGEKFTAATTAGDDVYFYVVDEDGEGYAVANSNNEFTIVAEGKYEVYAVVADDEGGVEDIMTDAKLYAYEKVDLIEANYSTQIVDGFAEVKVIKGTATYVLDVTADADTDVFDVVDAEAGIYELNLDSDNGFTAPTITVNVKDGNDKNVKGAELSYSVTSGYVKVEEIDSVTDKHGDAEIKIVASKAGDYKVTVKYGKAKAVINVYVGKSDVAAVTTIAEPTRPVALDTTLNVKNGAMADIYNSNAGDIVNAKMFTDIAFKLTDANGTVITADNGDALADAANLLKVTVVNQPADATLEDLELIYSDVAKGWVIAGAGQSFDEEGTYTFKVTLKNGASAIAKVTIKEFVEPVAMSLIYETANVNLGGNAEVKALMLIDKNGTMLSSTKVTDYTFKYVAKGAAVQVLNENNGDLTVVPRTEKTEALIGSTIEVMAICEELGLTATTNLVVSDNAVALKYVTTNAEVAVNNKLVVNTVDKSGNIIEMANLDGTSDSVYVYVLDAPKNAVYDIDGDVDPENNNIVIDFTTSAAGEYKVQLAVVVNNQQYLSSVETIVVGGTVSTFKDVVVMSIGAPQIVVNSEVKAIDAAPMIKDARTFVPFRALAEAFGAAVEFDAATQSVVAELDGVKVVMNIGENAYTVDGAAKTADVAPFISDSRTMVPVRFVAEAFGITVTPLYGENGATVDVLFAK